jgi:hypothetical protein
VASPRRLLRSSALLVAVLIAASSCSTAGKGADGKAEEVLVAGAPDVGYPDGPAAWLPDGTIYYLMRPPNTTDSPDQLYRTRSGGGVGEKLPIGRVASCDVPYLADLRTLAGGGLGAVVQCPQGDDSSSLTSIDTVSGRVSELSDLGGGALGVWSDVEHKGWVTTGPDGCVSLAPITSKGISPMPQLEPALLLPWDLDADFSSPGDCTARGLIGYAQPEPTMSRVIVMASPEAAGVAPGDDGRNRGNLPWHLYELDLMARRIRKVGGNFVDFAGPSVGAGKAVVSGSQDGTAGLYTVDLRDGATKLIGEGDFSAPALSPDGRSVVMVELPPGGYPRLVMRTMP